MTDIPYEKVVISQSMIEPNKIVAWDFFGGEDNIILMAEYSTPEKAEKAMQKLHECYTGVLLMQNVSLPEEGAEQLKNMTTGFLYVSIIEKIMSRLNLCTQFSVFHRRTRYDKLQTAYTKI